MLSVLSASVRSRTAFLAPLTLSRSAALFSSPSSTQAEIVLVGCGAPNRGMGWYHAVQLLDNRCPSGVLTTVVEPWFLGGGSSSPGGPEFATWAASLPSVKFLTSMEALPPPTSPRLALISGRTADNPSLVTQSLAARCSAIYLEKPGATTVAGLEQIRDEAAEAGAMVLMGFNKNVCKYVRLVREAAADTPNSRVTFVSNNAYEPSDASLGECFERNSEGMLKNMAIHELCLLVSFYDVSVDNIEKVEVDKGYSSMKTLKGPSGDEFTDFDKIKLTIWTKTGRGVNGVSIAADRCGGNDSFAAVSDVDSGEESFRWSMPDDEDKGNVERLTKEYPEAMPYFFTQDPDYVTVKELVAKACVKGDQKEAVGVATVDQAVETLKVAEYLTGVCSERLG